MITPPVIGTWIKIKLKSKKSDDKNIVWMGLVEDVSDVGILIGNGISAAGGGAQQVRVVWEQIDGYKYFEKDENAEFYCGEN